MSDALLPSPTPSENKLATRRARVQFWLLVCGAVVAWLLWRYRGAPSALASPVLRSGADIEAPITLVTADRQDLSCAMLGEIQGYRCAFSTPEQLSPVSNSAERVLAPYMTTHGQLLLIAGLFEQSAVQERYRLEPPKGRSRDVLRRFTAECKLRLLGEVEVNTRWTPSGAWEPRTRAWAGVPSDCRVSGP
jgi:hypothetical protein